MTKRKMVGVPLAPDVFVELDALVAEEAKLRPYPAPTRASVVRGWIEVELAKARRRAAKAADETGPR